MKLVLASIWYAFTIYIYISLYVYITIMILYFYVCIYVCTYIYIYVYNILIDKIMTNIWWKGRVFRLDYPGTGFCCDGVIKIHSSLVCASSLGKRNLGRSVGISYAMNNPIFSRRGHLTLASNLHLPRFPPAAFLLHMFGNSSSVLGGESPIWDLPSETAKQRLANGNGQLVNLCQLYDRIYNLII